MDDWESYRYVASGWADVVESYVGRARRRGNELVEGTAMLDAEMLDAAVRARVSDEDVARCVPGRDIHLSDRNQWPNRWQQP